MTDRDVVLENEHFRLERLADGVFAAVNTVEGGAMSNAGIIDLGGETVVFDAFVTRAAASELRVVAERLTGRAPRYLVNSHGHGDHVWGNAIFLPEAAILASAGTASMMRDPARATADPAELAEHVERLERALAEETDEVARSNLAGNLYPRRWVLEELPLIATAPHLVLHGALEICGSARCVRLVVGDRAHTRGDVYLACPEDRIVFLGDLGFFQDAPPYIAPEGDAAAWADRLREFESSEVICYVPGHGDVGGPAELLVLRGFLDAAVDAARRVVEDEGTVDDLIERLRETEYARWERTTLYRASLQSVLQGMAT